MSSNVRTSGETPVYNTRVVKQFAIMTVALVYVVVVLVGTVLVWEYVAAPVFTN